MKTIDEIQELPRRYYWPSDTLEFYDVETETFYNASGQELRGPEQYNPRGKGYTPFGDE